MGGNIFGFTAQRFDKTRLLELESSFSIFMQTNFSNSKWQVIPYYFEKETFGDLDIIVEYNFDKQLFINRFLKYDIIQESNGFKTNSVSISFLTKNNEQIDIIFNSKELYDSALCYYSWNDMGTFLGKIVRSHKLKYGFAGLYADYIEDSINYGEILLSREPSEIFKVFGWDYETYKAGFKTVEDIFKYVISLPNFEPAIYNFDETELESKRPIFKQFYYYLKQNNLLDKPRIPKDVLNSKKLEIINYFGKSIQYDALLLSAKNIKIYKSKLNGDIIKELTGLEGIILGQFIKYLKSNIDRDFVIKEEQEKINRKIKKLFKTFLENQ